MLAKLSVLGILALALVTVPAAHAAPTLAAGADAGFDPSCLVAPRPVQDPAKATTAWTAQAAACVAGGDAAVVVVPSCVAVRPVADAVAAVHLAGGCAAPVAGAADGLLVLNCVAVEPWYTVCEVAAAPSQALSHAPPVA